MIRGKIKQIELEVKYNIFTGQKKLKAVQAVKELLDQIDFTVEIVPLEDIEKLSRLLVTLKGKPLTEEENRLIEEIVNSTHTTKE